jgi:predicted aldo/keto reductase-like oxidoreductase
MMLCEGGKMKKKILGKTGLNVSIVGMGGIPLQRLDENEAINIVRYAIDSGVNFIDTARGYSVSEEYIGKALEGRRDEVILVTKSPKRDYQGMKDDLEESFRNLRTNYIDLYQFHFVRYKKDLDEIISDDGAYKALLEAKNEGRIGHIGITGHSADLMLEAINLELFETVQFPFNAIESQGTELFERAKELNMGTIAMKPIAGGSFEKGELSIKYILNKEYIDIAIPGMDSYDVVDRNVEVGNNLKDLTPDELNEIKKTSDELGKEFCRRCGYCLPCPQGIDIPTQFIFESYLKRYNLPEWAKERYQNLEIKADACIECGQCESKCPYNLPIIEMLKKVNKAFN